MNALFFLALVVGIFGASFSAYSYGLKRGRDIGWSEFYFESVRRDRERRNAIGQFKEKA
jgi:hypothetical protein